MKVKFFFSAVLILFVQSISLNAQNKIVHDAEYYILQQQHGKAWMAEDKAIDQQLAEFRKKNGGKPPNIFYILIDDIGFGDLGSETLNAIRGYKTPNINQFARFGETLGLEVFDALAPELLSLATHLTREAGINHLGADLDDETANQIGILEELDLHHVPRRELPNDPVRFLAQLVQQVIGTYRLFGFTDKLQHLLAQPGAGENRLQMLIPEQCAGGEGERVSGGRH